MARKNKTGLTKFNYPTKFDDNFRLAVIHIGNNGIGFITELWQEIFLKNGYYMSIKNNDEINIFNFTTFEKIELEEFNRRLEILFKYNIFSREQYVQNKILTSEYTQKTYLESRNIKNRNNYLIDEKYKLIDQTLFFESKIKGRLNKEYEKWKYSVLIRDNYTCKKCGQSNSKLDVHHIKSYKMNPELRTDIENGITLCKKCHKQEHKIRNNG